jgi:hypothetical protein
MSEKKGYITIKLSKFYEDLIDNYLEMHRENGRFGGRRISRANVVRLALDELFKKEGITQEPSLQFPPEYSKLTKELIFAHTILRMARGEKLPSDHMDLNHLKTYLRQLLEKKELKNDIKMNHEQREALVEELLQYHKQLLDMLPIMSID